MASLRTDEPFETGARIGRYEILSKIAAGGMATVFLGRAHGAAGFERLVALKVCHAHLLEDELAVERFLEEARLAARIHHPNVVATLDVVQEPTLCIVMEYVEGGSLASLIMAARDRDERIPPPIALRVVVDLLAGLHAAHTLIGANGQPLHLVHRDVTPQNVLVGVDGVARIADFGILKIDGQPSHTAAGNVRGKLPYLAPEQFVPGALTQRVDVYAAGVVLWEALAGARLFTGSDYDVAEQIKSAQRPPLRERVPELRAEIDAVIARAMASDPSQRFASAAELSEALEKLPVPLASSREVASYVNALLAEQIAERRATLQHATAVMGLPEPTQVTEVERATVVDRPERTTDPDAILPTAIIPAASDRRTTVTAMEQPRRRATWLLLPLAVVAVAVGALVVRAQLRPEPAPQPQPVQVKLVSPPVQKVEPPAPAPKLEPPPQQQPAPRPEPVRQVVVAEPAPVHHAAKPHHKPKPAHASKAEHPKPFEPDSL